MIDGRPITSGNIVEESKPVQVVLGNLACMISFNIISSPEHPIVLGLPWFELHNPSIDWLTREIGGRKQIHVDDPILATIPQPQKISTISLKELSKAVQHEEMFLFAIMINPNSNSNIISPKKLPKKYKELFLTKLKLVHFQSIDFMIAPLI